MKKAYKIVIDHRGCTYCERGKTWTIKCPNGYCIGQSYDERTDAKDIADMLNNAYEEGKKATL